MNDKLDFTIMERANIPAAHFAKLCGATRVSAFKWLRGANPRGLYYTSARNAIQRIEKALKAGLLPLPPTPRQEQFAALVKAIKAANKAA